MLFNSLIFLFFAALFFSFWPIFKRRDNSRWAYIVVFSFFFYGWWDWRFLFLLIATGLLDFFVSLGMVRYPKRRLQLLLVSISGNVGSLVIFKYSSFLAGNIDYLIALTGSGYRLGAHVPNFMIILPIGISFYTFQAMSYVIDVYRGRIAPARNPLKFFAYLTLFPQLVAGPIERAGHLLTQLEKEPGTTRQQVWDGLRLIVHGYFKKVVIADNLAAAINLAFGDVSGSQHSFVFWWLIIIMFAFQIYCDFSGYSDIARGVAKWMGFELVVNFDHPFNSTSAQEIWNRWHISLITWFRDYLFIPLGGSRGGEWKYHRNIWIVFLVAGLWHGAGMTFILWGAVHAFWLSLERITNWPDRLKSLRGGKHISLVVTFIMFLLALPFFRASSAHDAIQVLAYMFNPTDWSIVMDPKPLFFLAIGVARELFIYLSLDKAWASLPHHWLVEPVILSLMIASCVFLRGPGLAFIYFQF